MISVSDFLEIQTRQILPTVLRQGFYFFDEQAFILFVIILWTRGGSNFADGIDITLLRIIKISFCYIYISFVC